MDTPVRDHSSVPEAQLRWRLADAIALLLAVFCFASALFIAMAVTCAIPLYYSTFTSEWLESSVVHLCEKPGEINLWLGLVTISALAGWLGLLIGRRGPRAPKAPISASAHRFAVCGLYIDGALTILLLALRPIYLLLR